MRRCKECVDALPPRLVSFGEGRQLEFERRPICVDDVKQQKIDPRAARLSRRMARDIALPIICTGINDHALERGSGIISRPACRLAAPGGGPGDAFPVGIEQHFAGVETQTVCRVEQSLDAKCVELAWRDVGNEYMPVMIGAMHSRIEHDHARWPRVVDAIEQA
jgi:hypothetical protein